MSSTIHPFVLIVFMYTVYLALEYNSTKLCIPYVCGIGLLYSYVTLILGIFS